ncbi:MAG: LamG-like jellyroll fold domain-containing protein, partial [Planctomycetota bacterium]
VAGTFTKHNGPPRGSIALVDPRLGKNDPRASVNLAHPENPTCDTGESCDPWPLSEELVLYSGLPAGAKFNALMLIDRSGQRVVVHAEPDIDCHNPVPVRSRSCPSVLSENSDPKASTGRFFVQDVYEGLDGVKRGEVKFLRVIEETSRVSATPGGDQPYNQTFLLSCALAFSVKNFLGVVPVEPDGSAYFEVPAGRAVYLQALDSEGRIVRSMRTFVQAAPGVTRSCLGCHEYKYGAPPAKGRKEVLQRAPQRLQAESWGSGYVDFPGMVQPVLNKHCVSCHGGEKGFEGALDLTGGWTEHFSISYENLTSRRFTQLTAYLIAGIDCMNGTALWSAPIFAPRAHGSGAAPLAEILVSGHEGYIANLTRAERDLLLAWIDTNGLFHGTWDYAPAGCNLKPWPGIKNALAAEMGAAGCLGCHGDGKQAAVFEDDWFNLERPELSRILRAPLAKGAAGLGAGLCRDCKVDPLRKRVRMLWNGYAHAVQPVEAYKAQPMPAPPHPEAKPVATFASVQDPHYQQMLQIIRDGRRQALAVPSVDMPGAKVVAGVCRQLVPLPLPDPLPALKIETDSEGVVRLAWERSARTIGLLAELHRGPAADFAPSRETLLTTTGLFEYSDAGAEPGTQHYALVLFAGEQHSAPQRAAVTVPVPPPPSVPAALAATPAPGRVDLHWSDSGPANLRYHVYRAEAGSEDFKRLTAESLAVPQYCDTQAAAGQKYAYTVRAISRRGSESAPAAAVVAAAEPEVQEAVFVAAFSQNANAALHDGAAVPAKVQGKAQVANGCLDLRQGGHVTFEHRGEFELARRITVECWVYFTQPGEMPVVVSSGVWNQAGWFLQKIGGGWRWHVGGVDCDGGRPAADHWVHVVATCDGHKAQLYQDGKLIVEKSGAVNTAPWTGALHIGQYSGGPGPQFQVTGCIAGVKVYNRILTAQDAEAAHQVAPPEPVAQPAPPAKAEQPAKSAQATPPAPPANAEPRP